MLGPMPKPDTIVFDLDGTLIATRRLYVGSYQRAFAEVLRVELSEDEAERTGAQGGR